MDHFHKILALIDKNSENIPEGDYLELCNLIGELREKVKPPSFLLDQNRPLWLSDYDPQRDGPPVYEPTTPVTDGNYQMQGPNLGMPVEMWDAYWRSRSQQRRVEGEQPVTDGQPQEWIDEEEDSGLNAFLEQLHADWAATDDGEEEEQRTNWENVLRDVQAFQFAQPMEVD